jgi:hypothetical protein
LNGLAATTRTRSDRLDGLDDVHASGDFAEDAVLAVKVGRVDGGDEELGAVGVGAGVSHGEKPRLVMSQGEVLVVKLVAIDGLTTGSVSSSEITSLQHKLRDDSVE